MKTNFDEIIERRKSDSLKWNYYDEDVLPMWVADMDFKAAPAVLQALQERVTHGVFGYPRESGDLKEAIAERMLNRYGWRVDPEAVVFVPGVVTGFNLAAHALARPGGEVLMQTPVYFPFFGAAPNAGMKRVDCPLVHEENGRYGIDFEQFEATINEQTAMFLLCNPHNPVGRVFRRDELEKMAELCLRHGVPICSDEIHSDLVFPGHTHLPIAALDPEVEKNCITLIAPSKTFNIAGLECSAAIIPDEGLRKRYDEARRGLVGWVNQLGISAGLAAYREGQEWLEELISYLQGNRDYLHEFLQREMPGVQMSPVEGTYLAWLDCRPVGLKEKPAEYFLKKARVGLNEGETFGVEGTGFVRLNFGCPRSLLTEGLKRMARSLFEG